MNDYKLNSYKYSKILNEGPYYGPNKTYSEIPEPEIKFYTPIKLKKMDHDDYLRTKSRKDLIAYLNELESELYKLMIFDEEPKFLINNNFNNDSKIYVHNKDPIAYYDPTKYDKINQIKDLKKKIISIKHHLKLNEDIEFFETVKNSTFPKAPDQLVNNYKKSSLDVKINEINNKLISNNKVFQINGNLSHFQDIYNIRKLNILNHEKYIHNNILNNDDSLFKMKTDFKNPILDFINKKNYYNNILSEDPSIFNDQKNGENLDKQYLIKK